MMLRDFVRRRIIHGTTLGVLRLAKAVGCGPARSLGVTVGRLLHLTPLFRNRVATNLRAAGMDASDETVASYFRRFGLWVGHSLGVYSEGLGGSLAPSQIELDAETLPNLDRAVAKGRGVVLAAPHLFCHEIGAGLIARRHPVVALVRENKDPAWMPVKHRWYHEALGLETIVRPRKDESVGEVAAMFRVLRAGKVLGITPDVLTSRWSALPVKMFGRLVPLSPGMILLAMRSGAPLVTVGGRWETDPAVPTRQRARITFSEPLELPRDRGGDRDAALKDGLQRWCSQFEATLRRSPADWLFWIDKLWTRVLREPHVAPPIFWAGRRPPVVSREGAA